MKAILYIRVSTNNQQDGIERQIELCKEKAHSLGLQEHAIFIDENVSGDAQIETRKGLIQAIDVMQKGDAFIVVNRDRISRNRILRAKFIFILILHGVKYYSLAGDSLDDEKENLISKLYTEKEIELSNARTKIALQEKKQKNEVIGNVAFGFKKDSNNNVIEFKQEQKIIETAQKLRSAGYSYRAITKQINSNGFKNRNDNPYQLNQISRILKNYIHEKKIVKTNRILPYGFIYNGDKIEVCQKEQQVIDKAKLLRNQGLTFAKIVEEINALGYRNRKNNLFAISSIFNIISSKNKQDKRIGKIPYGFMFCPAKKAVSISDQEQEIINIVNNLKSKNYSLADISKELKKQGYLNRNGKQFHASTISKMIKFVPAVKTNTSLPYGFKYSADFKKEICPYEQEIIKLIYKLREQDLSLRHIAQELFKQGHKNRKGNIFQPTQIDRILKSNYTNTRSNISTLEGVL